MRLDKYLSNATDLSRSQAKKLIKDGRVRVDGVKITDASQHVQLQQSVLVEEALINTPGPRYFMLHKPHGYVCARRDRRHATVIDLLNESRTEQLHIAGRLDIDSTGLVLLTDDGRWSHRVTSPRKVCRKHYLVTLDRPLQKQDITTFAKGILLEGEKRKTRPAELIIQADRQAEVIITEGRFHQIKRMFAAIGNHVETLHRTQIGTIVLDSTLQAGNYRPLHQNEIEGV